MPLGVGDGRLAGEAATGNTVKNGFLVRTCKNVVLASVITQFALTPNYPNRRKESVVVQFALTQKFPKSGVCIELLP